MPKRRKISSQTEFADSPRVRSGKNTRHTQRSRFGKGGVNEGSSSEESVERLRNRRDRKNNSSDGTDVSVSALSLRKRRRAGKGHVEEEGIADSQKSHSLRNLRSGNCNINSQGSKMSKSTFNPVDEATQALAIGVRRTKGGGKPLRPKSSSHGSSSETDNLHENNSVNNMGGLLDTSSCDSDDDVQGQRRKYQPVNNFGGRLRPGECHYRSNLQAAIKELDGVPFTEAHFEILRHMPLWLMLKGILETDYDELLESTKKNEEVIREILETFDVHRQFFFIGGEIVDLTRRDVQLIFGVCDGAKPIRMKGTGLQKPAWLLQCFDKGDKISSLQKTDILKKLKELASSDRPADIRNFCRLNHLYLMVCVLSPQTNGWIPWHLAVFVADLLECSAYDWSGYIVRVLFESMIGSTNKHVAGATILLPYWLCEHTSILPPLDNSKYPRFLRWDLSQLYKKLSKLAVGKLSYKQMRPGPLKPTRREKAGYHALIDLRSRVCWLNISKFSYSTWSPTTQLVYLPMVQEIENPNFDKLFHLPHKVRHIACQSGLFFAEINADIPLCFAMKMRSAMRTINERRFSVYFRIDYFVMMEKVEMVEVLLLRRKWW